MLLSVSVEKAQYDISIAQMHLNSVGQGKAFWSLVNVTQHCKQRHQQGHHCSHEVKPEGQPACSSVKQEIVVGVDIT